MKTKQWEITAIRNKGAQNQTEWYKDEQGWSVEEPDAVHWKEIPGFCEIFSVKRLSDGIEFKIGDMVSCDEGKGKILQLHLAEAGGRMIAQVEDIHEFAAPSICDLSLNKI